MPPDTAHNMSEVEDEESANSSGSEYQPSACSSSVDSHSSIPSFEDVVQPSEESCSIVFPKLETNREDLNHAQCSKTPLDSQIGEDFQIVTVAGGPIVKSTGKRNYRKPDCLYCKNRYTSKISFHYLAIHSSEPKVIAIMELPCGSKGRKMKKITFIIVRNGCGEITVNRRPADKDSSRARADVYLPYTECKAWVLEGSLSIHSRSCPAGKSIDSNLSRNSKMLISPYITLDTDDAEIEDLIMRMNETSKHPGLKEICCISCWSLKL